MSKILDTINNIIEGEAQQIRAEERNALDAMTLASDNRFRRAADERAEKELKLRLKDDLEGDLKEAKTSLETQLGSEIDDMIDTKFEPILRQAAITQKEPYTKDVYSNASFMKQAQKLFVEKGFTNEQANRILNTVIAYKENPEQRGLIVGFFDDIIDTGTIDSYRKGFTALGLYGTLPEGVKGDDVQAQYVSAQGDSALGRFGQLQDVIRGIELEQGELRKGDFEIQRSTVAPDKGFDFNVQSAFTKEVDEELVSLNQKINRSNDRRAEFDDLTDGVYEVTRPNGTVEQVKGYSNTEKKQLTALANQILLEVTPDVKGREKTSVAKNAYGIEFGPTSNINRKQNATNMSATQLTNALAKLNKKLEQINTAKANENKLRKEKISMYEQTFGGALLQDDKNNFINTSDKAYDATKEDVQKIITILQNDLSALQTKE